MGVLSTDITGSDGWIVVLKNFDRSCYTSRRAVRKHNILDILDRHPYIYSGQLLWRYNLLSVGLTGIWGQ
jgi:hypothetical protein